MMEVKHGKSIEELVTALREAQEDYDSASRTEDQARHQRTSALNQLNAAQKALDAAIAKLKENAPRESDWAGQS